MPGKILRILLALVLLGCTAACAEKTVPPLTDGQLMDLSGIRMELNKVETFAASSGLDLIFRVTVSNHAGMDIDIQLKDVLVDGESFKGIGIYDLADGETREDYFFIRAEDGQGDGPLNDPGETAFVLYASTRAGNEPVCEQAIRIENPLRAVVADTAAPKATAAAQSASASRSYPDLKRGDSGEDVRRLQQALISLGYLDGSADGDFGGKTAQAVRDFRRANGFGDSESAESGVQSVLFGEHPIPYTEPEMALEIPSDAQGRWSRQDNGSIRLRVQVHNSSKTRAVKAFELYMYATDVWNERLYGEDTVYCETTEERVGPGDTLYSKEIIAPDYDRIDRVWVGIRRIVYTDGSIVEPDEVEYFYWEIC